MARGSVPVCVCVCLSVYLSICLYIGEYLQTALGAMAVGFSLNIFYFIIRNGIGQKLYNIMIALSIWYTTYNICHKWRHMNMLLFFWRARTNVRGANVIALPSASALASALAAWTKTLTLVITFKPEEIGLSYCTCVFLVTRPLTWYHNFWPCDLDLEVWPIFEKL